MISAYTVSFKGYNLYKLQPIDCRAYSIYFKVYTIDFITNACISIPPHPFHHYNCIPQITLSGKQF